MTDLSTSSESSPYTEPNNLLTLLGLRTYKSRVLGLRVPRRTMTSRHLHAFARLPVASIQPSALQISLSYSSLEGLTRHMNTEELAKSVISLFRGALTAGGVSRGRKTPSLGGNLGLPSRTM